MLEKEALKSFQESADNQRNQQDKDSESSESPPVKLSFGKKGEKNKKRACVIEDSCTSTQNPDLGNPGIDDAISDIGTPCEPIKVNKENTNPQAITTFIIPTTTTITTI